MSQAKYLWWQSIWIAENSWGPELNVGFHHVNGLAVKLSHGMSFTSWLSGSVLRRPCPYFIFLWPGTLIVTSTSLFWIFVALLSNNFHLQLLNNWSYLKTIYKATRESRQNLYFSSKTAPKTAIYFYFSIFDLSSLRTTSSIVSY